MFRSNDLHRTIGRLEGKIDLILVHQAETKENVAKLDDRVTKIETDWSFNRGVIVVIAGGVSLIGTSILKYFNIG